MTELEIVQSVADTGLPGRVVTYHDDMADMRRVKIRWGTDYWGQVCWSEDEREFKSEHWPEILKIRTWEIVREMLRLRDRTEESAQAVK